MKSVCFELSRVQCSVANNGSSLQRMKEQLAHAGSIWILRNTHVHGWLGDHTVHSSCK